MNFFRRLFRRKTKCYTYAIADTEEQAVLGVWLHSGLSSLDEAVNEILLHGRGKYTSYASQ
jgi:hypothetical protein